MVKVAVIGAGAAGLAAARRISECEEFSYVAYEQTEWIGGTWVYDERTGYDEYGLPIHTSMYKSLRSNLPKEIMGYPGFPIKNPQDKSYVPAKDILNFLQDFAATYNIKRSIKFRHMVKTIKPNQNQKWDVTVTDLKNNMTTKSEFDAVMVCNGHYEVPNVPKIKGDDSFRGLKFHAHDYRTPEKFEKLNVVVIGAGPSGQDIALELTKIAKKVYLSHHLPDRIDTKFPDNFEMKPDLDEIFERTIKFTDGSEVNADAIFYCTGYKYNLPFLSEECGVKIKDNYVHPLYKHFIVIENPTLCLIGLPFYVCAFSMFDLQSRFFLKYLRGGFKLPSKEEMLEDEKREMEIRRKEHGFSLRESHRMGPLQEKYYDELARISGIQGLPHVYTKLYDESSRRFLEDLVEFRNDRYEIIDEENYKWLNEKRQ